MEDEQKDDGPISDDPLPFVFEVTTLGGPSQRQRMVDKILGKLSEHDDKLQIDLASCNHRERRILAAMSRAANWNDDSEIESEDEHD